MRKRESVELNMEEWDVLAGLAKGLKRKSWRSLVREVAQGTLRVVDAGAVAPKVVPQAKAQARPKAPKAAQVVRLAPAPAPAAAPAATPPTLSPALQAMLARAQADAARARRVERPLPPIDQDDESADE